MNLSLSNASELKELGLFPGFLFVLAIAGTMAVLAAIFKDQKNDLINEMNNDVYRQIKCEVLRQ